MFRRSLVKERVTGTAGCVTVAVSVLWTVPMSSAGLHSAHRAVAQHAPGATRWPPTPTPPSQPLQMVLGQGGGGRERAANTNASPRNSPLGLGEEPGEFPRDEMREQSSQNQGRGSRGRIRAILTVHHCDCLPARPVTCWDTQFAIVPAVSHCITSIMQNVSAGQRTHGTEHWHSPGAPRSNGAMFPCPAVTLQSRQPGWEIPIDGSPQPPATGSEWLKGV